MNWTLTVPARPEPQARPRANFTTRGVYSHHPDFYYRVLRMAYEKRPATPFTGALQVQLRFCYKRPASRKLELYKTSRADLDNLEKAVLDALTGAKIWEDDALVVDKHSVKVWAEQDGCNIFVRTLPNVRASWG